MPAAVYPQSRGILCNNRMNTDSVYSTEEVNILVNVLVKHTYSMELFL